MGQKKNDGMRCRLRGKYWRINRGRIEADKDGWCDASARQITVRASLQGERELDVLLHEMLHACLWDLDEEAIMQTASDCARVLTRLGYHRD